MSKLKKKDNVIEIRKVYKSFGENIVHEDLNLYVPRGKTTVIVGPSGIGKSVLLKFILGLMKPDGGQVIVEGRNIVDIKEKDLNKIRSNFGFLFQSSALFDSMTVFDNVALPLKEKTSFNEVEIRDKVMSTLEDLGVETSYLKFPSQLSGGMKRRVSLARALQLNPKIILFDEPTTGLDPETKNNIYNLFQKMHDKLGYTALIVSHDIPKIFRIADYIAILNNKAIQDEIAKKDLNKVKNIWLKNILDQDRSW